MTINGINATNTQMGQMGMNQTTDSYSRNIQNQIANAQKQLQELSSNEDMTLEEKMKKRQEIQKQISDLNMQLRQHQMEQRKEKQQAKETSVDDMPGGTRGGKSGGKSAGLSQASMTAMISADASVKQSKVQGSVATKMEGRAGVLESEIKLDEMGGQDTTKKREELADVEQTAMKATESQMKTLGEANNVMKEAAEADSRDNTTSETEKENGSEAGSEAGQPGSVHADNNETSKDADVSEAFSVSESVPAGEVSAERQSAVYTHVDIRL